MSKKPILLTCQPDDDFWIWQNHLYIESCLKVGFNEEQLHILLYNPPWRPINTNWDKLKEYYPKLNIYRYTDAEKGVSQHLGVYIPILRPHILWQHFEKFPELEKETIIYTDCDILWTNTKEISKLYEDETCYMSNASSYMNNTYFENKKKDVISEKLEEYLTIDPLGEICALVGIKKNIVVENDKNIGGVQYILKGINSDFWKKVEKDILRIKLHLRDINKEFFINENKGIQSWCSDLWAVIFNLWYFKKDVKVIPEMEFAWSSDPISKLDKVGIFHNAGIVSEKQGEIPVFYKGKYHLGKSPFSDSHLEYVYNTEQSKTLCNWYYVKNLIDLREKYKLI